MKKKRYTLIKNGKQVCDTDYISELANLIGCPRTYIYLLTKESDTFNYKNITYTIKDLLK